MPSQRLQLGVRATFVGLTINILLVAAKLAAGILGRSYALIADAVESMADIATSLIVWRGLVVAETPPDEKHPYGHGKAEPIAAAIVALILLGASIGIGIRSVQEILHPQHKPRLFALWVLVLAVAMKEGLFRFMLRKSQEVDSTAMRSEAWHQRSDAITSFAAAVGITLSALGGPSFAIADSMAAVVAAGIIAWNGRLLLMPAMDELMDAAPSEALNAEIRKIAAETWGVDEVEKCTVRKMGYRYFVDMHLEVNGAMSVDEAHAISHQVKDSIRSAIPNVEDVLVHIEPSGRKKE